MKDTLTIADRFRTLGDKLNTDKDVTIGLIGGSITDGSLADTPEKSFADQLVGQFRGAYPKAKIRYANKGVGGTDSIYGCARVGNDLLAHHPDLVIVGFTVNDKDEMIFRESFEGLLRRILMSPSRPAVLVLENVFYDDEHSAQSQHDPICAYYGLPVVRIRESLYREIQEGKLEHETVTPDGLHPGNYGHRRIAEEIYQKLQEVFETAVQTPASLTEQTFRLPEPTTRNRFEKADMKNARSSGNIRTTMEADREGISSGPAGRPLKFRDGWIGRPGEILEMNFSGSFLAIFYRKTLSRPGCSAIVNLDGAQILLDGEFEKDWGECLYIARILEEEVDLEHHLTMTVIGQEDACPFYLNGLMTA